MRNAIKKISIFLLILFNTFFLNIPGAKAIWVDNLPTPTNAMDEILNNLGVNKTELKYYVQTMNVSRLKKQTPQVMINFDPADPQPGQKVTAAATPLYFLNDNKNLYYTWFFMPSGCPDHEEHNPSDSIKDKCDFDNDDDIDIEDYKIKAARLIVNNDFEWMKETYTSDSDDDGYEAIMGGDDQKGKRNHCYIYDTVSGNSDFEVECHHLFPNAPGHHTGDGSFGHAEERNW